MSPFLITYLHETWNVLQELAVWLLLGALVAGAMHVWLPTDFIRRELGGRGIGGVLKAVILGVPMPLCSCGVIPAAIGLKKQGASDGASTGFLISTPQTGVDSILVSASFLGWPFAIFKVASAFVTGLLGGWLVDTVGGDRSATSADATAKPPADADTHAGHHHASPASTAAPAASTAAPVSGHPLLRIWRYGVDDLLYMIWRYLVFGVLASALISTLLPTGRLADTVLGSNWFAMPLVLLISIPLYVCATSSVPIAAALVAAGMPAGAALVFLMAGPATNLATIGSVFRAFGGRVLGIYLAVISGGSIALGYIFQFVLHAPGEVAVHAQHHHGNPLWHGLMVVAAILLLALLLRFAIQDLRAWRDRRRTRHAVAATVADPRRPDPGVTLQVSGMTCQGCVRHVAGALQAIPGVSGVDVSLDTGTARVLGPSLDLAALRAAVRDAGYTVQD